MGGPHITAAKAASTTAKKIHERNICSLYVTFSYMQHRFAILFPMCVKTCVMQQKKLYNILNTSM
jgi:hypothetical protein